MGAQDEKDRLPADPGNGSRQASGKVRGTGPGPGRQVGRSLARDRVPVGEWEAPWQGNGSRTTSEKVIGKETDPGRGEGKSVAREHRSDRTTTRRRDKNGAPRVPSPSLGSHRERGDHVAAGTDPPGFRPRARLAPGQSRMVPRLPPNPPRPTPAPNARSHHLPNSPAHRNPPQSPLANPPDFAVSEILPSSPPRQSPEFAAPENFPGSPAPGLFARRPTPARFANFQDPTILPTSPARQNDPLLHPANPNHQGVLRRAPPSPHPPQVPPIPVLLTTFAGI